MHGDKERCDRKETRWCAGDKVNSGLCELDKAVLYEPKLCGTHKVYTHATCSGKKLHFVYGLPYWQLISGICPFTVRVFHIVHN